MAKKSRRVRRNGQRPRLSAAQMVQPRGSGAASETAVATPAPLEPGAPNLRSEYVYVINDLKRIGFIAAAMLALLIVLAIVLI
jgi:hypothetical protein